jgi:hypothetical protein
LELIGSVVVVVAFRAIRISEIARGSIAPGAGGRSSLPLPSQPRRGRLAKNLSLAFRCGLDVDRLLIELLHDRDYAQAVEVLANAIDQAQDADALAQSDARRPSVQARSSLAPTIPTSEQPSL